MKTSKVKPPAANGGKPGTQHKMSEPATTCADYRQNMIPAAQQKTRTVSPMVGDTRG